MLEYKGYIGTLEAEDGVFFGRVAGFARCDHFRRFDLRRSRASLPRKYRRLSGVLRRARRTAGSALQRQNSASRQSGNASSSSDARSIRGAEPQSMDRATDRKWPLSFPGGPEHADAIPYRPCRGSTPFCIIRIVADPWFWSGSSHEVATEGIAAGDGRGPQFGRPRSHQ